MDEDERRAFPGDEISHPDTPDLGETLLETGQLCVRHKGRLSFDAMNDLGGPER
jgi:hypothetical protein